MGIPELMMKHGHLMAAQREDGSGASSEAAAARRAAAGAAHQGVQRHFVADFGALVESKGPVSPGAASPFPCSFKGRRSLHLLMAAFEATGRVYGG